jgi:hypothetical protein
MEQRDSVSGGRGELRAVDTNLQLQRIPLLPFEYQLIEFLGCTEDEYRFFTAEALKRSRERPAEYALIPEINNGPVVPVLISLAVGLVFQGVAYLLTPKPRAPEQADPVKQRRLGSQRGQQRFNATYGFDGVQEIAEYGARIPILFGDYQVQSFGATGGIMTQPQLVWSRTLSYGSHQAVRLVFILGETIGSGAKRPELAGIYIGNNGLALQDSSRFAFYYRPGTTSDGNLSGRITANNFLYGSRGSQSSGDPWTGDDIFVCPTLFGPDRPGFCQTYQPTNATTFGLFNPIKNGTAYRLNWRIISRPKESVDSGERIRAERKKIAGPKADGKDGGMPGVGAGYSPCMGLISFNGSTYTTPTEVTCNVGDFVTYQINTRKFTRGDLEIPASSGVNVDDINNATDSARQAADIALQVGELFQIGNCLFKVESRTNDIYRLNGPAIDINLRCIEIFGSQNTIGIAGTLAVQEKVFTSKGGGDDADPPPNNPADGFCGPSFWPLAQVAIGSIRNTRPVDTTEIGIKSQVWNKASGLCNFQNVPRAPKLLEFDNDNTNLTNGTIDKFMARASAFAVEFRPAEARSDGTPYSWYRIREEFVIVGSKPVDQYNFIRLKPERPGQYEYRLVPRPGALLSKYLADDATFVVMTGTQITANYANTFSSDSYGSIRVTCSGQSVLAKNYFSNSELIDGAQAAYTETASNIPTAVGWDGSYTGQSSSGSAGGAQGGYCYERLGNPATAYTQGYVSGSSSVNYNVKFTVQVAEGKTLALVIGGKAKLGSAEYVAKYGTSYQWDPDTISIALQGANDGDYKSTGEWSANEVVRDVITPTNGNVWASVNGLSQVGVNITITQVQSTTTTVPAEDARTFERVSQIADVSHYDELTKSHFDGPEHQISYINESIANVDDAGEEIAPQYDACTTMGLVIRSSKSVNRVDQLNVWMPKGVDCYNWLTGSTGPSNLFCDLVYYLLTNNRAGLGSVIDPDLIDNDGFSQTARFLKTNHIYFDGAIADARNFRDTVSELAPYNLCSFVIRSGKFTIVPALPYDANGNINPSNLPIAAMFSDGNIIEDSFEIDYLDADERRDFRAIVSYREGYKNAFPTTRTIAVRWNEAGSTAYPQETFDLSSFCTHKEHALKVARYMLSIRRHVRYVARFKTTPYGLNLAPGNYIKVVTQVNPYHSSRNGVIRASDGAVLSADLLADGTYSVSAYRPGSESVQTISITISGGRVTAPNNWGIVFTTSNTSLEQNVYMVEQLTLDEEGLVSIVASHVPTSNGASVVATDVITPNRFIYSE